MREIERNRAIQIVPRTVPTLCVSRAFNREPRVFQLRVNVPLSRGHVAMACQVGQCPGVHVGRPARQARVAEGV